VTGDFRGGRGKATLVIAMPGSVRPPTGDTAPMITWLFAHGAPRTAEVLMRLQRDGWTIEPPDSDAATQSELWATRRFADVEQARAAAHRYLGRVGDRMRWVPGDRTADAVSLPLTEEQGDDRTRPS
jgi:hypothetical protein